jgi:hypothetical chaperone protein
VDRNFYPFYGELARERFLEDNMGRRISLEEYDIGYIQLTMGDNAFEMFDHTGFAPASTTIDAKVSGVTDRNLPGFLFAGTKRLLGQSVIDSVQVFGRHFKLEAIVASIVQHLTQAVQGRYGTPLPEAICVGRPVNYECGPNDPQAQANTLAISRMTQALAHAHLDSYAYFLEPIAPVLSSLRAAHADVHGNILVLDFGGGTLDFSLVSKEGNELEVIGNDGGALGGDIITEQLIRDFVFPLLGLDDETIEQLRERKIHVDELVPHVLNWRTTYLLNQPHYLSRIADGIKALPDRARALNRARMLIVNNFSYNLFYAVDTAKQQLSTATEARIDLKPISIDFVLTRPELDASIKGYLDTVETSIRSFCDSLGYATSDVDTVLLTGGTSLIPAIRQRIERLFPDKVQPIDPFMSIVHGFAYAAWLRSRGQIEERGGRMHIALR